MNQLQSCDFLIQWQHQNLKRHTHCSNYLEKQEALKPESVHGQTDVLRRRVAVRWCRRFRSHPRRPAHVKTAAPGLDAAVFYAHVPEQKTDSSLFPISCRLCLQQLRQWGSCRMSRQTRSQTSEGTIPETHAETVPHALPYTD